MTHYFRPAPDREYDPQLISYHFLGVEEQFYTNEGVFSRDTLDYGTRVLLETVVKLPLTGSVLDLGCGAGYIGILLRKYHPQLNVTMIDINELAVRLARDNSRLYGQENNVLLTDGFEGISDRFDNIVTNPPIRVGKEKLYALLKQAGEHLSEDGRMYLVIRRKQGAESALAYLGTLGTAEVINREGGYWIICYHN